MQEAGQLRQVFVGSGYLPNGHYVIQVLSLSTKPVLQAVQLEVTPEHDAQLVLQLSQVQVALFVKEFKGHCVTQEP